MQYKFDYTIIIPHYNIPELLVRCLRSIPIRENIQVIVVDDCSPDYATYRERFPELSRSNLEMYQTPEGGSAGRARNIGLENAKGKWILFADADDFFAPNMYEIISAHRDDVSDIIFFKADSVDSISFAPADRHIERNNSIDSYLTGTQTCVESILRYTVVWATMYSAHFIASIDAKYEETLCGNDVLFAVKTAHAATKPHFSNQVLYVITFRSNSLHDNKHKDYISYVINREVHTRLWQYCLLNNIRYTPPMCVLSDIRMTYRYFGAKAALLHTRLAIKDHALFLGLRDAICNKIKA